MSQPKKIAIVLVVAALLYLGGMLSIHLALNWNDRPREDESIAKSTVRQEKDLVRAPEPLPLPPLPRPERLPEEAPVPQIVFNETPPQEAPPGLFQEEEPELLKCWDKGGVEYPPSECGVLKDFFLKLKDRFWLIDQCKKEASGENSTGRIDLGIEVDFEKGILSFWNRPTSVLVGAQKTASCIREKLKIKLKDDDNKFARYQFHLSMRFTNSRSLQTSPQFEIVTRDPSETDKGRYVAVVRDRVRVRKTPVDGEILGKISSGNRVFLMDQQEGWCLVRTSRGNVGWMVCWGLELE